MALSDAPEKGHLKSEKTVSYSKVRLKKLRTP